MVTVVPMADLVVVVLLRVLLLQDVIKKDSIITAIPATAASLIKILLLVLLFFMFILIPAHFLGAISSISILPTHACILINANTPNTTDGKKKDAWRSVAAERASSAETAKNIKPY